MIASRWCIPARNPRAFRTAELLEELNKRDYSITTFLPEGMKVDKRIRYKKISIGGFIKKNTISNKNKRNLFQRKIVDVFFFLVGDGLKSVLYAYNLYKLIKCHLKSENNYNVIITISHPFFVNVALACLKRYINPSTVLIADCGDPFYANPAFKKAFYLKYLEKWVLRQFDYVTIPIEAAKNCYLTCVPEERIKIIPQGFKLMNISMGSYKKNSVPTFGYAGIFYESIRNPRYFFEYLLTIDQDFCFVVYAIDDDFTAGLLMEYKKKLGDKLIIREAVNREVLIPEMATWEFVINFDNDNSNQRPSKLIDYAMSKRPIISFNQATFKPEVFTAFLHGDYSEQEHIDLSQYDIRTVVDKFEELFQKDKARGSIS